MPDLDRLVDIDAWRRSLGTQRKKGWQRAVAQKAPIGLPEADRDGDTAHLTADPVVPNDPATTYQKMVDHLLDSAFSSPERVRKSVAFLRDRYPQALAHMSDLEVMAWLRQDTRDRLKGIVDEVYHRTGRGKELTIKTEGF